ncbi:hypothetical protein SLEP1_g4599 [Rubroshorea leprosula]|uniref:Uncharacterized protein n=1 Tax=Rubroshorea leprosula TaxID=152421 RepID=A0AAV5HYR4_9ROSI|nr:hypothetical protein SLEP1_g4599 [Rubroshorea leprosula]
MVFIKGDNPEARVLYALVGATGQLNGKIFAEQNRIVRVAESIEGGKNCISSFDLFRESQ